MNSRFSFTRPNFLSQVLLFLRAAENPSSRYPSYSHCNKFFSNQSSPEPQYLPPTFSLSKNPNPHPGPSSGCGDFKTICDLLTNPSFPPGPALEAALDRAGIKLGPSLLQQLFDYFGTSPEIVSSLFLWAERQPGYQSSVGIFNAVIKVLARARQFDSAWALIFDRLKQPLEGPDIDTFAILIRRYARKGMPSLAIRTVEFACSLDFILTSNSEMNLFEILLGSFCKEGLVLEASEFFNGKRRMDPSWVPSVQAYNILLKGWLLSRQHEHMESLWDEMKNENVKPSIVTYATLVKGYCQIRRVEVAIEFISQMRKEGIEPNEIIYIPIIDALAEAGRLIEALGMMERFLVLESGPNISTYNLLVKGFCKEGDLEGANKILKMMISRGCMPDTTTYNYFLRHFSKLGQIEEVLNLYTKMMRSGYTADRLTYHLLMKLFCQQERLDLAMRVRKEMKADGYDLDSTACTMLVYLLCKMHRFDEAFGELEDMIRRGGVPQYFTYQKMIDELKMQGMPEQARKFCDMMVAVPLSKKLPIACATDEDASRARRTSIIQKAKAMSDTLKSCRDPRELVKRRT